MRRRKNYVSDNDLMEWLGGIFIVGIILFIAGIAYYECRHPCTKQDPQEKTMYQTISCGDGCYTTYPVTYHDCLERKE